MLVSALAGREHVLKAYEEAIKGEVPFLQLRGCDVYCVKAGTRLERWEK